MAAPAGLLALPTCLHTLQVLRWRLHAEWRAQPQKQGGLVGQGLLIWSRQDFL
jgi:hypothetical protein